MTDIVSDVRAIATAGVPDGSAPIAVVDIGSNSIRLVIYEGLTRAPNILFNEKVQAGLGVSVAESGCIDEVAMDRAKRALQRFRALADQAGALSIHALATAAAREAGNSKEFVKLANGLLGTEIDVLSGKREAYFAAEGVASSFHLAQGVVGDMGGGSLELLHIKKSDFDNGITLPLGGLRLTHDAEGDVNRAQDITKTQLKKAKALSRGKGQDFFAVGGTWRNLAMLHMAETEYPLHVIHDYQIAGSELIEFCERIKHDDLETFKGIEKVSMSRKKLLPMGATVLQRIVKIMEAPQVRFSAFGVREGFLASFLSDEKRSHDPLMSAAYQMAVLRSRSSRHAVELCDWTDKAFAQFGIRENGDEQRYRWAACLLADVAWRAHPDYRGEQSLNLIAHGDFVGLDHAGRAYLALVAYYRNDGVRDGPVSEKLLSLAGERLADKARILGTLLRLAYLFTASMPNILRRLEFQGSIDDGLELILPSTLASLIGERPTRRAKQVGQMLGTTLTLEISEK